MLAQPRVRRALLVLAFAITVGIVEARLRNVPAGVAVGFGALIVATVATVPQNLAPGEYDDFGCLLAGALPIIWIAFEIAKLFGFAQ